MGLRRRTALGRYPVLEVVAIALVTSLSGYPLRLLRVDMLTLLRNLFEQCGDWTSDSDALGP